MQDPVRPKGILSQYSPKKLNKAMQPKEPTICTTQGIRGMRTIHDLMIKVKRYIKACHTCLKTKPKYMKNRPIYGRIPVDYTPMQDLSIDIKMMLQAFGGYHLLLVITCNQTNFMIAVPLRDRTDNSRSIDLQSYIFIRTT